MMKDIMEDNRRKASNTGAGAVRNQDREKRRKKRYRRRQQQVRRQLLLIGMAVLGVIILIVSCVAGKKEDKAQEAVKTQNRSRTEEQSEKAETPEERLNRVRSQAEAEKYPENIIELLSKNPETVLFVENYGKNKELPPAETIEELKNGEIPALYQWDERWGYASYGTGCVATSGCGPTCMSMIISGMTGDSSATPAKLAEYGAQNGYLDEDNNTYWKFMSESAKNWGITGYQVSTDEETVAGALIGGHPIVCSVGPGDFTTTGHFIVLTGYENGQVTVHDPFSRKNSEKKWIYSEILSQIKAVWIYSRE